MYQVKLALLVESGPVAKRTVASGRYYDVTALISAPPLTSRPL